MVCFDRLGFLVDCYDFDYLGGYEGFVVRLLLCLFGRFCVEGISLAAYFAWLNAGFKVCAFCVLLLFIGLRL